MRLVPLVPVTAALQVPAWLDAALDDAVAGGRAEARSWARANPRGSVLEFDRDALANVGRPPTGAAERDELRVMHELEAVRTPAGNDRAVELARWASRETWSAAVREIGERHGVDQARRAERLLAAAHERTRAVTNDAKDAIGRLRPYEVDPTLTPITAKPNGNASFPSGHTSQSFAAALVLAAFLPHRADELVGAAAEVAYSRVYGGVHFPSDVVAGARLAAKVVADVLRRDATGLSRR